MTKKLNQVLTLNQKTIENLPTPQDKSVIYYDSKEEKLYLLVSKTGTKTFYLLSRVKGDVRKIKIGRFPTIKVEKAREIAQKIKTSIACGDDPQAGKIALKGDITFKELFDMYIEKYAKDNLKSWKIGQYVINKHCQKFFNRKLTTITNKELKEFIEEKATTSKDTANTLLKKLKSIFNKGKEWEIFKGENPANNIKSYQETRRDRFLQPDELGDFFDVLKNEPEDLRDIVVLGLKTGGRKGNILSMEWNELDLINNIWRIPANKSKNGEVMIIPLLEEAKDILLKRKDVVWQYKYHSNSKQREKLNSLFATYVFPSVRNKEGHLTGFRRLWDTFLDHFFERCEAKKGDLRYHDLRRTLASYEALTGQYSLQIIGKSLGHKSTASTEIYARLLTEPVRASMNAATDLMKKQMDVPTLSQKIKNNPRLSNIQYEKPSGIKDL